jgi:hypothetical protein
MSVITYDKEYNDRRVRAEIEIVQASALQGITRTRLLMEAGTIPEGISDLELDRYLLRKTVYPDLIAGAKTGWIEIDDQRYDLPNLPFEVFEEIPFELLVKWEAETYKCNPHWLPEKQEDQKKASGNGSHDLTISTIPDSKTTEVSPNSPTSMI